MLDSILNPCNDPNAWWQQLLMMALPFLLGLLWPKGEKTVDKALVARLSSIDGELADCHSNTRMAEGKLKTALAAGASITDATISSSTVISSGASTGNSFTGNVNNSIDSGNVFVSSSKSKKDDLKVVEGIGPKIEGLFNDAGINTFEDLANSSAARLKGILEAAGSRYQMHDPTTWPAQSKLASEGKWEELKKWQDELNKGQ